MAHKNQSTGVHLSRAKTNSMAIVGIGLVFIVAVLSGVAYDAHDQAANREADKASQTESQKPPVEPESINSDTVDDQIQPKEQTMTEPQSSSKPSSDGSTPNSSNTSNTSTSITVNGHNVTVKGSGSMNKSITSSDGRTKVHISVNNSQSSN